LGVARYAPTQIKRRPGRGASLFSFRSTALTSLHSQHFVQPSLMALLARKPGRQIRCGDLARQRDANHSGSHAQHVEVVVLDALMGGIGIVAQRGAGARNLVGRHGRSDAAAANNQAPVRRPCYDRPRHGECKIRVIVRLLVLVRAQVEHFKTALAKVRREVVLQAKSRVITANRYLHIWIVAEQAAAGGNRQHGSKRDKMEAFHLDPLGASVQEVVIVEALRTAVGKAPRGTLKTTRPDDMAAAVIKALLASAPQLQPADIDDVILGCAMPEAEQGMNMARIAALLAGLPDSVPGMTINRFCSSGLQAIAIAADRIRSGGADVIIAGGAESMSLLPKAGHKFSPNPALVEHLPQVYINMGLTAEKVVAKYDIPRNMQDDFALWSHQKAAAAQREGKFEREIVPLEVEITTARNGSASTESLRFAADEGVRYDTSYERLASLPPVFQVGGMVTAGNSSQTSDGAAAALVMSARKAADLGLKPLARFVSFASAGVPPEIMGIGPVVAIPKALALAALKLDDIGLIELNEAFACQALAVIKLAGINSDILNVNGGAVALGHPLGATGAKLTATLLHEMQRRKARYGLVTMCVGGGQGAAGIFERM
jgi:acetyl-CoA acyltransferase